MINSFSSRQNKEFRSKTRGPRLTLVPQLTSIKASGLGNQTTPAKAGPEKPGCNKSRSSAYKVDTSTAWAMGNPIIIIVVILHILLIVTAIMKLTSDIHDTHLIKPPMLSPKPASWYHVPANNRKTSFTRFPLVTSIYKDFKTNFTHTTVLSREKIQ